MSETVLHTPYTVKKCFLDTLSVLLEVGPANNVAQRGWWQYHNPPDACEKAQEIAIGKMDTPHSDADEAAVKTYVQNLYDNHEIWRPAQVAGSLKKQFPQFFSAIDPREEWFALE